MFGKNICLKAEHNDPFNLQVHSIFFTFQGEGPYVGKAAVFIRLSGCNLACKFCDTEFDHYKVVSVNKIIQQVKALRDKCNLVVITGGEPLRQNISYLTEELCKEKMIIQIETNGTIIDNIPLNSQIICSPKNTCGKYNALSPKILPHIMALKFLISADIDGYKDIAEIGQDAYKIPVYIQPMDQYSEKKNKKNMILTMEIAKKHNAIISLQIHKILNIE